MEKMITAGMNIAMLNLSYGTREENAETIKMLKQAAKNVSVGMGRCYPLAIGARLAGRKIRTGRIAEVFLHMSLPTQMKIMLLTVVL